MKTFVKENTWLSFMDHGWGNGYVIIPKGHPYHGKDYGDIDVDVHGGLTLSELAKDLDWPEIAEEDKDGWVVGFDTAHYNDNSVYWTKRRVEVETKRLERLLSRVE